ncbi:MAG TPA: hypothetical protein VFY34_08615 [Pyrinomonadaceae bacterium]|nr:hypothetical protein [Pyrinomonadaceae bacterium]
MQPAEIPLASANVDFDLLNHSSTFIYPFNHKIASAQDRRRLESLEECWSPWWRRLDDRQISVLLDSTYFFLPYIREVLFPETSLVRGTSTDGYESSIKKLRYYSQKGLTYTCSDLPAHNVLRFAYKEPLLAEIASFSVVPFDRSGAPIRPGLPAQLAWVDVVVFTSGLGFLLLKVHLAQDAQTISQAMELNYYLRMVHPPSIDWRLPALSFNGSSADIKLRDLLDFLTQGFVDDTPIERDLLRYKTRLKETNAPRYSDTEAGQIFGERCHFLSYACVNFDSQKAQKAEGIFSNPEDHLLFEFASSLQLGDSVSNPMWIPAAAQTKQLMDQNRFAFWRCWRGMSLKESVVFLGTEDIGFNRVVLPQNIEYNYLPLYIYTLHQKYKLFTFSSELMRKSGRDQGNLSELRFLMDSFMKFRNRYWFSEVTRKPLGSELYRKFQYGLEVPALYELVSNEVKDLKEYYEQQHEQRISILLAILTFVFLPLGAVVGIFGMTFFSQGSWRSFIVACVLVEIVSLGVWKWWTQDGLPDN